MLRGLLAMYPCTRLACSARVVLSRVSENEEPIVTSDLLLPTLQIFTNGLGIVLIFSATVSLWFSMLVT